MSDVLSDHWDEAYEAGREVGRKEAWSGDYDYRKLMDETRAAAIRDCIQVLESTAGFNEYSWGLEAADADETGKYVDSYEVLEKLSSLLEGNK